MSKEPRTTELPLAAVQRIAKKAGAERVGTEAGEALIKVGEAYLTNLVKKANALAVHAGRKTLKAEDIELANKSD